MEWKSQAPVPASGSIGGKQRSTKRGHHAKGALLDERIAYYILTGFEFELGMEDALTLMICISFIPDLAQSAFVPPASDVGLLGDSSRLAELIRWAGSVTRL